MKKILVVFSLFILIGCGTTPPTEAKVKRVKENVTEQIGIMTISCLDLNAIIDLAESDRLSAVAVQVKLRKYVSEGKCGIHKPRIPVPLETLIDEYVDFMGIETQIWKVKNLDLWTLMAKNVIKYKKLKKKNKDTIKTSI